MTPTEIYAKTTPFILAKLLLGLVTVGLSAFLFAVLAGLAWLFKSEGVAMFMFLIWLGAFGVIRLLLMHYAGYLLQAGHIAVITQAVITGEVPDDQLAYGKRMVLDRFATASAYFAADKLVALAVKQIQRSVGQLARHLDFLPGLKTLSALAQYYVDLSLGYLDECCLGYTFFKKDQNVYKSAADGVVIYAQNWQPLLLEAAKTMALVILALTITTLVLFLIFGLIFQAFSWPGWVAFVLALLLALTLKYAFLDSFVLTRTIAAYMSLAPTTVLAHDLYGTLSGLSPKFKELYQKGSGTTPAPSGI